MADVNFEAKFAKIVDNELTAKLPSLKDYHVGFQLVEKSDDETRAIGINAFLINGIIVYNPCFFINGQFKGMDLLYVQPTDMFVPAMDNWIVTLKNQTNDVLGIGKVLGADKRRSQASVDIPIEEVLYSSATTPITKTAAAKAFVTKAEMEAMCNPHNDYPNINLQDMLQLLPKSASAQFFKTIYSNADFANAVFKIYKPEEIHGMAGHLKEAFSNETTTATARPDTIKEETADVTVYGNLDDVDPKDMTEKEKALFMANGVYVKDPRKRHSVLFNHTFKKSLENPSHDGVYDVLLNDGTMAPVMIFTDVEECDKNENKADYPEHRYPGTSKDCATRSANKACGADTAVVFLDKPTFAYMTKASELFVRPSEKYVDFEQPKQGYGKDFNKRSLIDSSSADSYRSLLLVQIGGRKYRYSPMCNKVTPVFTGKDGKLGVFGTMLTVPKDVKAFSITWDLKKVSDRGFGNMTTVEHTLTKEAGIYPIKFFTRAGEVELHTPKFNGKLDKIAAINHLAKVEGIAGGQVVQMLKQAEKSADKSGSYFIKYAGAYEVENAPGVRGEVSKREESGPIETMNRQTGQAVMPQQFVDQAIQASDKGNRQIFDITVLNSLIQASDISEIRKNFIKDIIKGMDKVGRLLFVYYWHSEDFEERYGKSELADLEDKLKQVFKQTGDLVLFLKEKMPLAGDTPESLSGSLSEEINASDVAQ